MSTTQHHTTTRRYIDERSVADILGVSVRTLQGWRMRGRGPRYYRLGTDAVRYRIDEVQAWAESQPSRPEAA